jgi:hypothetical protein
MASQWTQSLKHDAASFLNRRRTTRSQSAKILVRGCSEQLLMPTLPRLDFAFGWGSKYMSKWHKFRASRNQLFTSSAQGKGLASGEGREQA